MAEISNSSGWGTEGSEGRWVRQACIGRSVIFNYQVCCDKTSGGCYIPTHCPRLPANVTAALSPPIGWMDDAMCGGVCVGGGAEGRADAHAGTSPCSPRLSVPQCPRVVATHWGLSMDGRAGSPVRGSACWLPAFDCARRKVPRCN